MQINIQDHGAAGIILSISGEFSVEDIRLFKALFKEEQFSILDTKDKNTGEQALIAAGR